MAGSGFSRKECLYGRGCRRPDCHFLHSNGREMDAYYPPNPQLAAPPSSFTPSAPMPLAPSPLYPTQTTEVTPEYILDRLKRVGRNTVIFVDGDNLPEVASILLELFPLPLPPAVDFGFMVIAFIGVQANFKAFPQAAKLPCFMYMRALIDSKDAADHCLTSFASIANQMIDYTGPLYICSRDGFARGVVTLLKHMKPQRDIQLIGIDAYRNFIVQKQSQTAVLASSPPPPKPTSGLSAPTRQTQVAPAAASAPKTSVASSDSTLFPASPTSEKIRRIATSQRPEHGYPCKICKRLGGLKDSHWYWHCPFKSQKSTQRDVIGDVPDGETLFNTENQHFIHFVTILIDNYSRKGITNILMSDLGKVLKLQYVYSEKNGLKPLVTRAVDEGLIEKTGDLGSAAIIILEKGEPLKKFIEAARSVIIEAVEVEKKDPAPVSLSSIQK